MAERLGDAVLVIRTDDAGYEAGISKARTGAERLGDTMDRTSTRAGAMGRDLGQAGDAAGKAGGRFQQAGQQIVVSAGAQRAGMQQLGMQLNDAATMYALGMRPMQIYTSQIGQVTQAVQLMSGGTSRWAAFLGGPWGIALTTASIVLAPFISKLWEGDRALKAVELSSDALADAQSLLGGIFDLTTGKIASQNQMLRENARIMAFNLQTEAMKRRGSAREVLTGAQRQSTGDSILGSIAQDLPGQTTGERNAAAVNELLLQIGRGEINREQAIVRAQEMDFTGTQATMSDFIGALRDASQANSEERLANMINQSLDSGELAPGLRTPARPGREKRGPKGPDADKIADQFLTDSTGLMQDALRLQEQLAATSTERVGFELQALDLTASTHRARIEGEENYSEAQKAELLAKLENRTALERELILRRQSEDIIARNLELARGGIAIDMDLAQIDLRLAETRQERLALELRILDLVYEQQRFELEAVLASQASTEAQKRVAAERLRQLDAMKAGDQEAARQGNASPAERYLRELREFDLNLNDEVERVQIDGLERLNDEIVRTIMNTQSLGDAFKNVANQIIADLLRIGVQRQITGPLADMMFGEGEGGTSSGGGGGLFGKLFGSILSPSGEGAEGGGGEGLFAGLFAKGGLIPSGQFGIVGEEGPELAFSTPGGTQVIPQKGGSRGGGSGGGGNYFDLRGALMTEDVMRQMNAAMQEQLADGLMAFDAALPGRIEDYQARSG